MIYIAIGCYVVIVYFVLQGGRDDYFNDEDDILLYGEDGWAVHCMNVPRSGHAVSSVNFDDFC